MKKSIKITAAVSFLTLMSLLVNAQEPHSTKPVADAPDLGSVSGSTYTNKYFGLALTVPTGWSVQDSSFKKAISEKGKEVVTSDDPATKGELNRAVDATLNLLTVTERPVGSPGENVNSMLILGAERPPAGVKTDADYMLALKNTLQYAQVPITIEREPYAAQIGGTTFSAIDFNSNFNGVIVSQKYYAHMVKDYVVFFIITYQKPEQEQPLQTMLRSVTLH